MPVIIKTREMQYKDNAGVYHGINAVAEKKTSEIIADMDDAVQAMQEAADGIDAQRETMIASIASVAGQGTDTTLTQSGVAADAKAAGDEISDLKSALNGVNGYDLDDVFFPVNLYNQNELIANKYLGKDGTWYTGGDYANYSVTGYIRVIPGRTIYFYSNTGDEWAARNISRVVAFNAQLGAMPTIDVTNVYSYSIPSGVQYVRLSISNSLFGTNNAVYLTDDQSRISLTMKDYAYGVNGNIVSYLKYAHPITKNSVSMSISGDDVTFTAQTRFLTSDNTLINCNDSITFTLLDTIRGVAVDENGNLAIAIPTAERKADNFYFLVIWYNKNIIFDTCGLTDVNNSSGFIYGSAFAWISNKKLYMTCTQNARFMYNGLSQGSFVTQMAASPISLTFTTTETIKYVYYDGSGLAAAVDPPKNGYVFGYVYNNMFTALDDRIIANRMPVFNLKQRQNVPTYINFRRLGWRLVPPVQSGNSSEYAFFGTSARITNAYSASDIRYVWLEDDTLDIMPVAFSQNTSSLSGKKILTVGDSITARGWYQHYIQEASGAEFVGTHTSIYYNVPCEGFSGMNAAYIFGSNGPFWNPTAGKMDFEYYCTQNNISPDIVTCLLGLNESETPQQYFEYLQAFVDDVKAYNSSIAVYIIIPFGEAYKAWYGTGAMLYSRFKNIELMQCECYGLTDCTLIPAYYVIDDDTDYHTHSVSYGVGDLSFDVIDDGVHPDETTGFKKLANIIYNYLE